MSAKNPGNRSICEAKHRDLLAGRRLSAISARSLAVAAKAPAGGLQTRVYRRFQRTNAPSCSFCQLGLPRTGLASRPVAHGCRFRARLRRAAPSLPVTALVSAGIGVRDISGHPMLWHGPPRSRRSVGSAFILTASLQIVPAAGRQATSHWPTSAGRVLGARPPVNARRQGACRTLQVAAVLGLISNLLGVGLVRAKWPKLVNTGRILTQGQTLPAAHAVRDRASAGAHKGRVVRTDDEGTERASRQSAGLLAGALRAGPIAGGPGRGCGLGGRVQARRFATIRAGTSALLAARATSGPIGREFDLPAGIGQLPSDRTDLTQSGVSV